MISQQTIVYLIFSIVISIIVPLALLLYFRIKYHISLKSVLVGALIFLIFTQVLEKALHFYVMTVNQETAQLLKNPAIFAAYGCLAAGIFEEIGRFIGFKYLLARFRSWADGVAYGIGHGGIESILIGGVTNIQNIIFARLVKSGQLESTLQGKIPLETLTQLKDTLINTPPYVFSLAGIERIAAVTMQIALSLLVLYAVKEKRFNILVYAILLHAAFNLPAALYQMQRINVLTAEAIVAVFGILAYLFIIRARISLFYTDYFSRRW